MTDQRARASHAGQGDLPVSRGEFSAVWREARRLEAEPADSDLAGWYISAVAHTCRWLAAEPMRTALCGGLMRSPVTQRACLARAEAIESECRAAEHDAGFAPDLAARPGWCDGVRATLRWAWTRDAAPPIDLDSS